MSAINATPKKARKQAREWKPAFLRALANGGNIRAAALAAGVDRHTVYRARAASAEFAKEWDAALEDACDILEAVATERAKASSDTLLIFLLKAHRPEKYRETYNVRLLIEREAASLAESMGVPVADILDEFNALIGATR